MVRYVRQKDYTSCGPIALINILKWMGFKVTYDNYIDIARFMCKHEPGEYGGTEHKNMAHALKAHKIKYKRIKNPTLKHLDPHLDKGGIILLDYIISKARMSGRVPFIKGDWHYILCIGRTPKTYVVVNDATRKTVGRRKRKTMEKMLGHDKETHYAWLISK